MNTPPIVARRIATCLVFLLASACTQQVSFLVGGNARAREFQGVWDAQGSATELLGERFWLFVDPDGADRVLGYDRIADATGDAFIGSGGSIATWRDRTTEAPDVVYFFIMLRERPVGGGRETLALYRQDVDEQRRLVDYAFLGFWEIEHAESAGESSRAVRLKEPDGHAATFTYSAEDSQHFEQLVREYRMKLVERYGSWSWSE